MYKVHAHETNFHRAKLVQPLHKLLCLCAVKSALLFFDNIHICLCEIGLHSLAGVRVTFELVNLN